MQLELNEWSQPFFSVNVIILGIVVNIVIELRKRKIFRCKASILISDDNHKCHLLSSCQGGGIFLLFTWDRSVLLSEITCLVFALHLT